MATDTILVLITLATAVVGTIFNLRPWFKAGIIVLAVSATTVTWLKAYDDHRDKDFIKGALAALLGATKPPPAFENAFVQGLERAGQKHGLRVDGSVGKELGSLYFFAKDPVGVRAGAMSFMLEDVGEAFIKHLSRQSLDRVLESAMFNIPNMKTEADVQKMLDELALVANIALDQNKSWVKPDTDITTIAQLRPARLTVSAEDKEGHSAKISIEEEFIDSVAGLPPIERNWKAYQEFGKQLGASP